jgi:hypothetical protein
MMIGCVATLKACNQRRLRCISLVHNVDEEIPPAHEYVLLCYAAMCTVAGVRRKPGLLLAACFAIEDLVPLLFSVHGGNFL